MADCTVTLTTSAAAISGAVRYEPMPNQIVGGVSIDTAPVTATAASNTYTATLVQGVRYRILSSRVQFVRPFFRVPAASTADLEDLIDDIT